jgi:hypothetical protein
MERRLVLLGASTFLADVGILTPAAVIQMRLFADGSANGTGLQKLSNDVPRVLPPSIHDFLFFPDSLDLAIAHHNPLPCLPLTWMQAWGHDSPSLRINFGQLNNLLNFNELPRPKNDDDHILCF